MKEGYIIYVVGEDPPRRKRLEQLIRENHLDLFEYRICGHTPPLAGIYSAYQDLQQKKVSTISCLSVSYDPEKGSYQFLEQSLNVNAGIDLGRFCSPQELGN